MPLELPTTPDIKDIKKVMLNRDEKIASEIIKPRDELIKTLHKNNVSLAKQLSKQTHLVEVATKLKGDYLIPNLVLDNENTKVNLGKYGLMRLSYLKKHKRGLYTVII